MTETMDVTLPNGRTITDVPVGATKAEVRDRAIRLGVATNDDFKTEAAQQASVAQQEPSAMGQVGTFVEENLDIPGGIAGAITGMKLGAPGGLPGMFVGGTLGGAVGTFGGAVASDALTEDEIDYANAVDQALISMGFDIATLGAGKVIKPAWIAGKKALGFSAKEVAEEIAKIGGEVGTKESLQASQNILAEQGASLTPFQVGADGWWQKLQEQLAQVGLLSGNVLEKNAEKVNEIVAKELTDVTGDSVLMSADKGQIAEILFDVVQGGKKLLSENYDAAWKEVIKKSGNSSYTTKPYVDTLNRFVKERQGKVVNSLSDDTLKYISSLRETLSVGSQARIGIEEIATIEKKIGADIAGKFGNPQSPMFNSTMERELAQLSDSIRGTTARLIRSQDPDVASIYAAMNKGYSEGMAGLLPEMNKNFISQASKDNYLALGNLIGKAGNIDQVIAFKRSLNQAFSEAYKAGKGDVAGVLGRKEADALLKRGFLQTQFPDLATGEFSIKNYQTLANKLADKSEARRWKAVLGDDYPRVKQLVNLMSEASRNPSSNIGELVFRSKEYQALSGAAQLSSLAVNIPAGAAILGIPVAMAKIITNPKHVNKLIAFDKAKFESAEAAEAAFAVLASDILDGMSSEEQAEVRNAIRDAGSSVDQENAA